MKNILRAFVVAGIALSASFAAQAADLPQRPPPQAPVYAPPPPPPVYNWSGFYFGVNGGYGWGNLGWTPPSGSAHNTTANGGIFGATLGFNYQVGAFVWGVEGDFDWSGINGSTATAICNASGNCQTGNTWLSTLRGRAGFAVDRILFYGTAGGVFGNDQTTIGGTKTTHQQAGWTAGAGVEVAFAENWTAKIEYLYAELGTGTVTCVSACGPVPIPISVGLNDNLIRAGVNYKFNF